MDSASLRAKLAKDLGHDIPDQMWKDLEETLYVATALNSSYTEGYSELCTEAKRLYGYIQLGANRPHLPGRSVTRQITPALSDAERQRAETFAVYLARHAATTPTVQRFRADVLQHAVLSPQQALDFLNSPATRYLSQDEFAYYGIPIVGHTAIEIQPPKASSWPKGRGFANREDVTLRITWADTVLERQFGLEEHCDEPGPLTHVNFACPTADGQGMQRIIAWPRSVLGQLHAVSAKLSSRYFWSEYEAMLFLLTDTPPRVSPLAVEVHRTGRAVQEALPDPDNPGQDLPVVWPLALDRQQITMTVDAWVSADTVLRAYKQAQKAALGRDNRQPKAKNLAVLRFVAEHFLEGHMTWDKRMTAWNKAQTKDEWKFSRVKRFEEACKQGERLLCFPAVSVQRAARGKR